MSSLNKLVRNVLAVWVVVTVVLGTGMSAVAQTVLIRPRPLTPQEIKNAGLTNTTQLANGLRNVGVGDPIYLEALLSKGQTVTNVTWSFIKKSPASSANFTVSPLLTNVLASYDVGDRNTYVIASRAMLVPDIANDIRKTDDFVVQVAVALSSKTLYATSTVYGSVYMGAIDPDGLCVLCHNAPLQGSKMDTWGQTAHATAFKRKINGEAGSGFKSYCVSCHVVGYDASALATNGGFDDIARQVGWVFPTNLATAAATNNWDLMPLALQNKANIQCESCHGPADRHARNLGDKAAIGLSLSAGNCGFCHDSMTHHVKNYEWSQSIHGSGTATYRPYAYFTNWVYSASNYSGVMNPRFYNTCGHCHSAQGFILDSDPDWAGETNPLALGTGYEGITCAACHDPHSVGVSDYQLRGFSKVVLMNNLTNTLGGTGLLCMQCHHDRRDTRILDGLRVNDTNSYTPHHGTQGDMLIGANAVEYGLQMPKSRHLNVMEDSCIECHMAETPTNGLAMNHLGGHTWTLSYTTNSTTYELTETCVKCHGEIEGFNFGGIDYDHDGVVEGVQVEVQGLLDTVAKLLPYGGVYGTTNKPSPTASWTLAQKKAAYNYLYVWEDRSRGVHNPKYATAILQASIDDLRGGIDVDRDGLLDSWEVTNFGSITAQDGNGDPDSDGVINKLEMAAGTNPNVSDSDYDGVSDLAELQGGSNPLSAASKPSTNSVTLLPAIELAYMPGTMGVTQQFQTVNSLSGDWTNIGSSFVSSNAWFYQLQTLRSSTQNFFRVITK